MKTTKELIIQTNSGESVTLPAVTPKPTKKDLIAALVERARAAKEKEKAAHQVKIEAAKEKFQRLMLDLFKKSPEKFTLEIHNYGTPEVEYSLNEISPAIADASRELRQLSGVSFYFDEQEVKRRIITRLNAQKGDAVQAMLGDAKMVKALDGLLKKLA